jgi:2-dehydropantoate 2-reductase
MRLSAHPEDMRPMRILVYGAGVIGTLYAAKLVDHGEMVTVLARGRRLEDVRRNGLLIEDIASGTTIQAPVAVTDHLAPDDCYDLALVTVRRDQLAAILPVLGANRVATMLFMLNNPTAAGDLAWAVGKDRVLLGFPGAGGTLEDQTVRYAMIAQQPTTVGEPSGMRTHRLAEIADLFGNAGFPTRTCSNMDAWLKTHAFFVTAVSGAIYMVGGDCRKLSGDYEALALMTQGVREGLAAIRALGLTVTPLPLRALFNWLPPSFAIGYWRRFLVAPTADWVFGRHARSASGEMAEIANDCRALLERCGIEAPALRRLYQAIDAYHDVI